MNQAFHIIDHFVILGVNIERNDLFTEASLKELTCIEFLFFHPKLEKNEIPKYLENFQLWCFPEGFEIIDENSIKNEEINSFLKKKEILSQFVITDEKGVKRYCTCQIIYEKCYIKRNQKIIENHSKIFPKISTNKILENPLIFDSSLELCYIPKTICIVSRMPVFELQKQYLKYLYENLIEKPRQKKAQIIRIPTKYLERLDNLIENNKECSKAEEKFHENFKRSYSLEKSAINAISIKEKKLWEFYVSALFSLIDCADEDKEVSFLSFENKEMFRFRINNNVGLSLPDFSFKILFRRLSTGNIIKILKYILLESQIIFFANNTSEIVTITETLLSLISPLTWCCIYIPFLPALLYETLNAMIPFIIGMNKKEMNSIKYNINTDDKIIVDIDNDIIYEGVNAINPKLPVYLHNFLRIKLDQCIENHTLPINIDKSSKDLVWAEIMLNAKKICSNFMMLLINNIIPFFKFDKGFCEKTVNSSEIFDFDAYLSSFDEDKIEFIEFFARKSMMFNKFIEDCYSFVYKVEFVKIKDFSNEIFYDDISYFLINLYKILREDKLKSLNHFQFPDLLDPLIKNQNETIIQILNKMKSPEKKELYPFLIKFIKMKSLIKNKKKKMHFSFQLNSIEAVLTPKNIQNYSNINVVKYNKTLELIPKLDENLLLNLNKVYSNNDFFQKNSELFDSQNRNSISMREIEFRLEPLNVNLKLSPKKLRKNDLLRLKSYENSNSCDLKNYSPDSKILSKIKNYYVYYHAIKRNKNYFNEKDFFQIKKRESKFSMIKSPVENIKKSEKLTPFFKDPLQFKLESPIKLTIPLHFPNNPQDSNDVTPENNTTSLIITPNQKRLKIESRKLMKQSFESMSFSKWMQENSVQNVSNLKKLKEEMFNFEDFNSKINMARSLSPPKKIIITDSSSPESHKNNENYNMGRTGKIMQLKSTIEDL